MRNREINSVLDKVLGERDQMARGFLQEHDDLAWFFNTYFATMGKLSLAAAESNTICNSFERSLTTTMWQQAIQYHLDALIHILTQAPDSGLALLRSATELARDFSIIAKEAAALPIWKNRADSKDGHEAYRGKFRFDSSRNGQAAWRLYKFCCKYGAHGHLTGFAFSSVEPSDDSESLIYFQPARKAVSEALVPWLLGVPTINNLFIGALNIPWAEKATRQPHKLYLKLVEGLPIIKMKLKALSNSNNGSQ